MKRGIVLMVLFILSIGLVYAAGGGGGGSSGGPGSGSSGGGTDRSITFTDSVNDTEKIIDTGEFYTINLKNKSKYTMFIKNVDLEKAVIVVLPKSDDISGSKQEIVVLIGNSKEIDLDEDGISDILYEINYVVTEGKRTKVTLKDEFEREVRDEVETGGEPIEAEGDLLCGDKSTRLERVQCRLNLDKGELEYEYKLNFLPEECIPLENDKRAKCINVYKVSQPCWEFMDDKRRVECVREQLEFEGIGKEREKCETSDNRKKCIENLKEKAFSIIKFRFYNLEEKAEYFLRDEMVSFDAAAEFISNVEGKKIEFNEEDIEGKKSIVLEVRKLWKSFLEKVDLS